MSLPGEGPTDDSVQDDPVQHIPAGDRPARIGAIARPLLALLAATVSALAVVGLARTAVGTASGQRLDQLILSGAQAHEGRLSDVAEIAVSTVSLPVIAALLALAVLLVLVRRRPDRLLPIVTLVLGANLTTQVIKRLLVTREVLGPGIEITPNSFPSGHTTLAAATMIALVLAGGRARAVLAPLGVLWTTAAGIGTLVVGWHRPSDVIGAITVVAAWTFLVLALDGLRTRRRRTRARAAAQSSARTGRGRRRRGLETDDLTSRPGRRPAERAVAILLALLGGAGLAVGGLGLATLPRPLELHDTAQQLGAFADMATLIGGGTAAWMALMLLLRVPTARR